MSRSNGKTKILEIFVEVVQSYCVISPESTICLFWDIFLMNALIVLGFIIPFDIAFIDSHSEFSINLLKFSFSLFFVDIIFNLNTGVYIRGEPKMKRLEILKQYSRFWLWIDLISTIPFEQLLSSVITHKKLDSSVKIGENFNLIRGLRLLKLIRLTRISSIFMKIEDRLNSKDSLFFIKILKILLYLLLVANGAACLMALVSSQDPSPISFLSKIENSHNGFISNPFDMYILSLYWAMTTMVSVGFGDISPQNTLERIVGIIVMNFSSIAFGFLLGNFGSIISQHTAQNKERREIVVKVNQLMKLYKVQNSLRTKSINYVNYAYGKLKSKTDKKDILEGLSRPLKEQIYSHINGLIINSFPFFKQTSESCKGLISRSLTPKVNSPNDFVFKEGTESNTMYFITKGFVEVVDDRTGSCIKVLSQNSYFGEIGLILDRPRCASILAPGFLETLSFAKPDFTLLTHKFPTLRNKIAQISIAAQHNDLSGLHIECFLCRRVGHIAKCCSKTTERESNQRKWLSSRKESQIIRKERTNLFKKHEKAKKMLKIRKLEGGNIWGKKKKTQAMFPGNYYLKSILKDYNNELSYQASECFSKRPSIFYSEFEISMLMQSIKNYELVLSSEESEDSEIEQEKIRESSFDTTLITGNLDPAIT